MGLVADLSIVKKRAALDTCVVEWFTHSGLKSLSPLTKDMGEGHRLNCLSSWPWSNLGCSSLLKQSCLVCPGLAQEEEVYSHPPLSGLSATEFEFLLKVHHCQEGKQGQHGLGDSICLQKYSFLSLLSR